MREPRQDEPSEIFGSYQLFECLGRGGMATVHRAKKTGIEGFERPVALKRLLPWLTADPDYVKSFVREARLAAQLRHVNIAQTYDLGKVDDVFYIAMELVPGRDAREVLRQCHNVVGPMPVPATINLLFQLCDALEYAHTFRDDQGRPLGLVHRDISPANVIIANDGTAKLVDFGVAKGSTATLATSSGLLKGKFAYMAPEMLQGQVDARGDLFAVGVMAWELLTARPLFAGGDDMEILQRVTGWDPPPPSTHNPTCPRELDAWVAMALTKQPQRRFQSATQMRAGLELVARRPALRATSADLAGWIQWAFEQQSRPRPAPTAESLTASIVVGRPETMMVDEASIEVELRAHTAIGVSPARNRSPSQPPPRAPSSPPAARTLMVDDAAVVATHEVHALPRHTTAVGQPPPQRPPPSESFGYGHGMPAPIVIAPSSPHVAPSVSPQTLSPAAGAAAAASRTVLFDPGNPPAASYPAPGGQGPTQYLTLPAQPPGAGAAPLPSQAATISPGRYDPPTQAPLHPGAALAPGAGPMMVMTTQPLQSWGMAPRPDGAYPQPGSPGPGHPDPYAGSYPHPFHGDATGTPGPRPPVERRARTAAGPGAAGGGGLGIVIVLLLCAAAAVGGFFLVQHLL